MILQCDQCNTKFRLDDSKMKPGGVKVRCSKCRHVFLAGAEPEPKQEDTDFEALLAGLGAPAAEKAEEPTSRAGALQSEAPAVAEPPAAAAAEPVEAAQGAPAAPASAPDVADFGDFDFGGEPTPPAAPAAPAAGTAPEPDFDDFDFSAGEPAAKEEVQHPAPSMDDYGDFAFMDEPPAMKEEPAAAAAPAGEALEFGEFAFSAEPVKAEAPAAPASDLGFGELDFNEAPAVSEQAQEPAGPELDFGEFSFDEEPAAKAAPAPPAAPEEFPDFAMGEEPAIKPDVPAAKEEDDFADFTFEEAPAVQAAAPAAAKDDFDFGDFSFGEEAAPKPATPAAKDDFDFGDFTLGEQPAVKADKPAAEKSAFDFSEFSFGEEPPPLKETPSEASEDFGAFFASHEEKTTDSATARAEGFSFGDVSAPEEKVPAADEGFTLGGAGETVGFGMEAEPAPVPPAEEPRQASTASSLDFSFGGKPLGSVLPEVEEEEELPPLSISSRRKGRSLVRTALLAIAVVLVVAITGAGLYLLQSGPSAAQTFDKIGLGFVAKWFGIEAPDEGRITIAKPLASFYQNKDAGELFVVTGQAVNNFTKARASIHVRVSIFDKKGAVIMQKTAYCGNKLSKEQLETLPIAKIDQIMNNQFGDSLSNLGVKPGQSIGFVVAMANVPKEAADFGVEVVGSTVAGQ